MRKCPYSLPVFLHAAAVGGWKQSNAIEESLLQVLWLPGLLSEGPCVPRVWGIVQESSSGTRGFVGAAALCGTAMGAALQSLNERNERWFKIWRNLRGRNSTEDGYIATWTELAAQRICFTFFHVFPHIFVWGSCFFGWALPRSLLLPPPPASSHTTCSHTTCSHTTHSHTTHSHTTCQHTTYTQLVHTQLVRTQLVRTQLTARDRATSSFAAPSCVWPKIEPASLTLARNQSVPPEPRAKVWKFWDFQQLNSFPTWILGILGKPGNPRELSRQLSSSPWLVP